MRRAEDGNFLDGRLTGACLSNVPRINVHTAGDNHILFAVCQVKKAVFIHIAHVTGNRPLKPE
jgi:hypothetical protein